MLASLTKVVSGRRSGRTGRRKPLASGGYDYFVTLSRGSAFRLMPPEESVCGIRASPLR